MEKEETSVESDVGAISQFLLNLIGTAAHRKRPIFADTPRLVTCAVAPLDDAIFSIDFVFNAQLEGDVVVGISHVFRRNAITGRSVG